MHFLKLKEFLQGLMNSNVPRVSADPKCPSDWAPGGLCEQGVCEPEALASRPIGFQALFRDARCIAKLQP